MKPKVLMVGSDNSVKGGISSVISQLLNHQWEKENVEMQFIPTFIEGSLVKRSLFFVKGYFKIFISLLTFKPDIIHIHMSYNGSFYRKFLIHRLCKLFGKKNIIHLHGSQFEQFYQDGGKRLKKYIRYLLRECDCMYVLGENWNNIIKSIEPSSKTYVLNNTVFIPETLANNDSAHMNILFLGVLVERKGVMDLLFAAKELQKENLLSDYNVTFKIGGTGNEEEKLKQYVEENNLANYVDFLGWISGENKNSCLQSSQLFVLPSYNEGLPIAILEAMSYGLPVISTNVGSINEAVKNEYNGYLFEPGDVESLSKFIKMIIMNKQLYNQMSINSRDLAESKFSDINYFKNITKCYREIL